MTEERKVQLGIAVDASDAKAGFEQVKQDARDMAQAVGQAGQAAGKGMDAIGDGAKRSADAMNREEGRMRAAIQRATLELRTLGKTASEKLEAKIELQGLDAAKFAPYLAALKQAEDAQRKLQESSAATGAAIQRAGMTWNEFSGQRIGPVTKGFTDQGLPDKEAHTAALRQIRQEFQQYKAAGVAAQTAVATQTAATTAALGAEANALSRVTTSLGATSFVNLDKVGTSLGAAAAKADEAAAAVHRLQKEIAITGPLATAGTSFGAAVGPSVPAGSLREAIERRGQTQIDPRLVTAFAASSKEADVYAGKLRTVTAGQDGLGMSTKQLNFALRQVPMQMTDIVVSLAAGQRPLQVLLQQGGQLKDLFGGIGPAARALGTYALGLVNPFTVAAAAVAGLGFAMAQVESRARGLNTLQAQLAATGRAGMFSDTGLKEFTAQVALAPGVTREAATSIISELSKVHEIGGDLFRDLAGAAADYAKATGTDVPTAARTLAKAFADPVNGAKQLDAALGTLSSTQLLQIERLSKMGDIAGAQRVLFAALQGSIKGLADNALTPLGRSTNEFGNAWEGAMRKLDQSDGLRNLNILLGKTVDLVAFLVNNADKIGGIGNIGVGMIPGVGAPAAIANAIPAPSGGLLFGGTPKNPTASGRVTDLSGAAASSSSADKSKDDFIKKAREAAAGYRGEAEQLANLTAERDKQNTALKYAVELYGKNSAQAQNARNDLAGANAKITAFNKRGTGGGGNEPQQVLDEQLNRKIKATRDALADERDQIAFNERFLQGEYQAGEISLAAFYSKKIANIQKGTEAQVAALEKERQDVQAHLEATRRTSPKDKSALEKDETRLQQIAAEEKKVLREGEQATKLANQDKEASFIQLNEEVLNYRANLKQMAGDEAGAARIRNEIADRQDKRLAARAAGSGIAIPADVLETAKRQRDAQADLIAAKTKTSEINQILQIEEDRIALSMRTGAVGEIEALNQLGGARAKAVAELEKVVKAQEEVAASRPQDYQLQIDTSRARLELEKLKAELDPLKEKFDTLFKDTGASFLEDLMNGAKPKDALKSFFGSISREINSMVAKELSGNLFGKGGALGGAGGLFAKLFGGKDAAGAGVVNTPQQALRLSEIAAGNAAGSSTPAAAVSAKDAEAASSNAAARSLNELESAAKSAAAALNEIAAKSAGASGPAVATIDLTGPALPPVADGSGATGDFARFDRRQSGESAVADMFTAAQRSSVDLGKSNDVAANAVLQMAQAAVRGGDAMSMLPAIIQAFQAAVAASRTSTGGSSGGIGSLFTSLLGSGGQAAFSQTALGSSGFGTGLAYGNQDIGLYLHEGGIVGQTSDRRPIPRGVFADAGTYHAGGMVGGAREPRLAANEVPAILMGGPKGTREEVLTASDPRHQDNIRAFSTGGYTGNVDEKKAAGVVHGKEYVFSAPAVRAIGVDRLERLHTKAKYSLGRADEDELPGYSDGGYVAVIGSRPSARGATATADRNASVTNNYTTVQVTAGAGVTREQALNQGRDIRRGIQTQAARRARDI